MPSLIPWTPKTYNRIAGRYDGLMNLLFPIGARGHRRVVEDLEADTILDVACGTGSLLNLAHEKGSTCVGLDLSDGMLGEARSKSGGFNLVRGSFYSMPFRDACIEVVASTNAISAVDVDPAKVLSEMARTCTRQLWIADYSKPGTETLVTRILAGLGGLIGDRPHDYPTLLTRMGCPPLTEELGHPMYQYHQADVALRP